jgi:hypothetical protein
MAKLSAQTAPELPYPPEATKFADQLESIMADGTHDLAGIAAGLNERHIVAVGRSEWTAETLRAYLAELANAL